MKVLIIKLGAIGDVVMTMPLLTHLHKKYPGVLITWVCGEQVSPLLNSTNLVHEVIIVNERALLKGWFFQKLKTVITLWKKLFLRTFDLCITAYADPRYRILSIMTLCKKKSSFYRNSGGQFPIPGRYHVYEYLRLASTGKEPLHLIPEFPKITLPKRQFSANSFIVLAPGGAKNVLADDAFRRWPIQHYAALMQLLQNGLVEVVVTGVKSDEWVTEYFQGMTYTNLIGKLTLIEMLALLKEAQLLVTHDSGPLHLGKLVDCPTIAIFGPTNPWEKISIDENIRVVWGGENLSCRPCYDGKKYAKCIENRCMSSISPDQIFKMVQSYSIVKLRSEF